MDAANILPIAAILIAAVVIVIGLLRFMRARQRRSREAPPDTGAPLAVDEEEYLDSSHIGGPIFGNDPRQSDAAARAAAALRNARNKKP